MSRSGFEVIDDLWWIAMVSRCHQYVLLVRGVALAVAPHRGTVKTSDN